MSKYTGPKSWTYKFTTYCPQTSTGLWFGITKKQRRTEEQMREDLYRWTTDSLQGSISITIFDCFIQYKLSDDILRQFVGMLNDSHRHLLEETVYSVLIKKELRPQNCVINCIRYVKLGLVQYFEELNGVLK